MADTDTKPPATTEPVTAASEAAPIVEAATKESIAAKPDEKVDPTPTNPPPAYTEAPTDSKGDTAWLTEARSRYTENEPFWALLKELPTILKDTAYNEVYGLTLTPDGDFPTELILQKFLRANSNNVTAAAEQLSKTLQWRKEFQPLAVKDEIFSKSKFGGLGYITTALNVPGSPNTQDIVTYNIYGAVKSNKETFGDVDAFMRWRVALMEMGVARLGLAEATRPIPSLGQGPDPYQGYQVHDYLQVSFLRQDPLVKAASKRAIETFGAYYPETMSRKFFVNVPVFMQWMFNAVKMVMPKTALEKLTVMSYGTSLAGELGTSVPQTYGGEGKPLEEVGVEPKSE